MQAAAPVRPVERLGDPLRVALGLLEADDVRARGGDRVDDLREVDVAAPRRGVARAPVARHTGRVQPRVDTSDELRVVDAGRQLAFTFADLMRYHGPGSPGGVAHAFKVMERALPLLDPAGPVERRAVVVRTAFGGPGARDAFEIVLRAVTEGRYMVDAALARPERGRTLERFVFRLAYGDEVATLAVREGFVPDELIELARRERRTGAEERRLDAVKREVAERVMAAAAADV